MSAAFEEDSPIENAFWKFYESDDGKELYVELVTLARLAYATSQEKIGIKMLFEVVRYQRRLHQDHRAINNNFTALYARVIMADNPDLMGAFDIRR